MTLPSSGAISINSLVGEYGGSAPHSMSEYYRGGGLVANHSNNGNVPTSGTISLSNFYGQNNTPPTDSSFSGTLANTQPTINKYNVARYGASRSNSPQLFTNYPATYGSLTDNIFTNPAGTVTITIDQFWWQTDDITPSGKSVLFSIVGNYAGQTWAQVTGRTGITVAGVSQNMTSSTDILGNVSTPTFTQNGAISYINIGVLNNTTKPSLGSFSGSVY